MSNEETTVSKMYNQNALNRIATRDQLDKAIVLVSPSLWISIVGALLIIAGLCAWGFQGKLPTSMDISGIYLDEEGMSVLYSPAEGFVTEILVEEGDTVKEGQLVATLGTEDELNQIKDLDTRIGYVEDITFDSELDIITGDTEALAQIKLEAKNRDKTLLETEGTLDLKKQKLQQARADLETKEADLAARKEKYFATLSVAGQQNEVVYSEANQDYTTRLNLYESAKNNYISAMESCRSKESAFDARYEHFDESAATEQELEAYRTARAEIRSAEVAAEDYRVLMEQQEEKLNTANSTLEQVRGAYLQYLNQLSGTQVENMIANTEYTEALQAYTTAQTACKALQDEVDQLELKMVLDENDVDFSLETYQAQFDNQKSALLYELENQREDLQKRASKGEIHADRNGEVYDLQIAVGKALQKGGEVFHVFENNNEDNLVICYVPLSDAKKIETGMEAQVYPSTINKQECGHMIAEVEYINPYVATTTEMERHLGSDALVQAFSAEGAVVEVHCRLEKDGNTASGYQWSSEKGNEVMLSTGTLVTVTVITGEKKPIDLLIPYLKKKLDFAQ